jgi:hypothetical protein
VRQLVYCIADDRDAEPRVRRPRVRDDAEARKLASRILQETYHHMCVEVWDGGERLLCLTSFAETGADVHPVDRI